MLLKFQFKVTDEQLCSFVEIPGGKWDLLGGEISSFVEISIVFKIYLRKNGSIPNLGILTNNFLDSPEMRFNHFIKKF